LAAATVNSALEVILQRDALSKSTSSPFVIYYSLHTPCSKK